MDYPQDLIDLVLSQKNEGELIYSNDMIIDMDKLPPTAPVRKIISFIYNDALNSKHFKVKNFYLFLLEKDEMNAWAWSPNSYNVIGIHKVLIDKLHSQLRIGINSLNRPSLKIVNLIPRFPNIDVLTYQFIIVNIYSHELAHLNQNSYNGTDSFESEKCNLKFAKEFCAIAHGKEIDADYMASTQSILYFLSAWNEVRIENKNYYLQEIFSVFLASIFVLFQNLYDEWPDFYDCEYSHPHPVIRVLYITEVMLEVIHDNILVMVPTFTKAQCVREALLIAKDILPKDEDCGIEKYMTILQDKQSDISDYLSFMKSECKKIDCLIMNRAVEFEAVKP